MLPVSQKRRLNPCFTFTFTSHPAEGHVAVRFDCDCEFHLRAPFDEEKRRVSFIGTAQRLLAKHLRFCGKARAAFEREA